MHVHLVNFLQATEGMSQLLKAMNLGNIHHAVVFGLPVKKKWPPVEPLQPSYYLDDDSRCYYWVGTDEVVAYEYSRLSLQDQKRLAPCHAALTPLIWPTSITLSTCLRNIRFGKGLVKYSAAMMINAT